MLDQVSYVNKKLNIHEIESSGVKMNTIQINVKPAEFLSKDILEDNFINSFRLINLIQMIMGVCRVHVKDRFITGPTIIQKLYTVVIIIIALALDILVILTYFINFVQFGVLYYLMLSAVGIHLSVSFANMIHARFFNGNANAAFYIKMQQIDRLMKIERNVPVYRIHSRINNLTVAIILTVISFLFIVSCSQGQITHLGFFGSTFCQSTFILEMAYCSNFIIFFYVRVKYVNCIMYNHIQEDKCEPPEKVIYPSKKLLRSLASESHDFESSTTDLFLKEIFDAFSKFQDIYKFQVLIFCTRLVMSSIISFEVVLLGSQYGMLGAMEIVVLGIFILLDVLIITFLCLRCEMFFREVKETKRLSVSIMSIYYEGAIREKARRMYKMIEDSPPRFSVYDMWQLEARIFLQLFMLVTTLIVTLIQFALL